MNSRLAATYRHITWRLWHAGLGNIDQASHWLGRAFDKQAVDLFTPKVEPMFDGLRADPRFYDLLSRVGLASASPRV